MSNTSNSSYFTIDVIKEKWQKSISVLAQLVHASSISIVNGHSGEHIVKAGDLDIDTSKLVASVSGLMNKESYSIHNCSEDLIVAIRKTQDNVDYNGFVIRSDIHTAPLVVIIEREFSNDSFRTDVIEQFLEKIESQYIIIVDCFSTIQDDVNQSNELQTDIYDRGCQSILHQASEAIMLFRDDRVLSYGNRVAGLLGFQPEAIDTLSLDDFLKMLKSDSEADNVGVQIQRIKDGDRLEFDWINTSSVDSPVFLRIILSRISFGQKEYVFTYLSDISQMKMSEMALRDSEEKYRSIFDFVQDGILILDIKGNTIDVNQGVLDALPVPKAYVLANHYTKWLPPSVAKMVKKHIDEVLDKGESFFEFDIQAPGRIHMYIEVRAHKFVFQGQPAIIAMSRDISRRRELQQKNYNIAIEAEEKERARVARELHDGVSPILSTTKLYTQTLKEFILDQSKLELFEKIENTLQEAILSVSEISNNLSPHILQNLGLKTAIESFINRLQDASNLTINYTIKVNQRLAEILEVTVYRVVIELLNNTIKYAKASVCNVELIVEGDVYLCYQDDGIGFDVADMLLNIESKGLFNVLNRVRSLNGSVDIDSNINQGMKLMARIPLYEE